MLAVLVPRGRQPFFGVVCALGYLAGVRLAALLYDRQRGTAHAEIAARDPSATGSRARADASSPAPGLAVGLVSYGERMRDDHVAEYYALLAAAGAGMCFLVQARTT